MMRAVQFAVKRRLALGILGGACAIATVSAIGCSSTGQAPQFETDVDVTPAEGDLKHLMEIGEGAVTAHQEPPPDHGADLLDPSMDLVDLGHRFLGHGSGHRTRGRPRSSAPGLSHSPTRLSEAYDRLQSVLNGVVIEAFRGRDRQEERPFDRPPSPMEDDAHQPADPLLLRLERRLRIGGETDVDRRDQRSLPQKLELIPLQKVSIE